MCPTASQRGAPVAVVYAMRLARLGIFAACTLSTLTGSRVAHASQGAPSCTAFALPPDGATIPANAPAVYVGVQGGTPTGSFALEPRLVAASSDADILVPNAAKSATGGVFALATPLVAGRPYTLSFAVPPAGCFDLAVGADAGTERRAVTFTAGPAAPLPTRAGTLAFVDAKPGAGTMSAQVNLRVTYDAALAPFRNVVALEVHAVDGAVAFNGFAPTSPTVAAPVTEGIYTVYESCDTRVGEIRRTYRLDGFLFGAHTQLEGAEVGAIFTCSAGSTSGGSGSSDASGTASGSGGSGSGGGCDLAAAPAGALSTLVGLFGVALVFARRRIAGRFSRTTMSSRRIT